MDCSTPGLPAAAAAKLLQSCLTLCDPIDRSPPGSPVPGILQARTLEWAAISFSNAGKWKVKVKSLSRVRPSATPWTAPTRLLRPWDFQGKSTGVGCHCLLPGHHQLPEFTQTHVHRVDDAIQPLVLCRPLLPCPQSFPASGSFPMSQLFASSGQSTGVWASVLPMNIQDWSPLGWTGWISLQPKRLSGIFPTPLFKTSILRQSAFFMVHLSDTSIHDYWKNHSFD